MYDSSEPDDDYRNRPADSEGELSVPLGPALGLAEAPPEGGQTQAAAAAPVAPIAAGETRLEAGIQFVGNALLAGPCTVAGEVQGHLRSAEGATVAVVITATGRVRGDVSARHISVFGKTEGLLDAGSGEVALHDGAGVQGTVRYGRIRVDGADLNATLERVAPLAP